jgi:hypothetical protein
MKHINKLNVVRPSKLNIIQANRSGGEVIDR